MEQPISENLWWVLPNKLAGVRKPYLISTGSSFDDAMQIIQSVNPNVKLRGAQITFLQGLVGE